MKVIRLTLLLLVFLRVSASFAQTKSMEENMAQSTQTATKDSVPKIRVLFYLQDGVEVLDFAGPMEVFAAADFDVVVVSKIKTPIISEGILKIVPDFTIDNAPKADIVAIFGGQDIDDPDVIRWLKSMPTPTLYFSVCSGALTLGKAGILNGLTVTTHYQRIDDLKSIAPKANVLSHVRYVDNGNVITTAGISAGIDGALHIVAKLKGEKLANQIAKYMEYDKYIPNQGLDLSDKKK
jgi:transcriptional regulator GlxA family with amidase domain